MTLADLFVKTYKYIEEKKTLHLKQNKVNNATTDRHVQVSMTHSFIPLCTFVRREEKYIILESVV